MERVCRRIEEVRQRSIVEIGEVFQYLASEQSLVHAYKARGP